jgi:hypothetical protein
MTVLDPEELRKLELWKMAAKTRELEIGWFWQRSNYFLVLSTAIAAGFLTADDRYRPHAAAFGAAASVLWFLVNLGGKFWQARWEERASITEKAYAANADLFSADWPTMIRDARNQMKQDEPSNGCWMDWAKYRVRQFHRYLIVEWRPSVSEMLTLLSLISFCMFLSLFVWSCWPSSSPSNRDAAPSVSRP